MAVQQLLQQSAQPVFPFITVGRDERGSACWQVVGRDVAVRCYCGQRAIEIMRMMCRSRGMQAP